jgi:hypothetical protein
VIGQRIAQRLAQSETLLQSVQLSHELVRGLRTSGLRNQH